MKRSRFSAEKIFAILRERVARVSTAEFCRKHGICDKTLYNLRNRLGDTPVSEVEPSGAPEAERAKFKKLRADAMIDNATLEETLE